MGDMNNREGIFQVNLPHIWDSSEDTDKEWDNQFGSRPCKDKISNSKGKKLIEFCKRNTFEMLNAKYGSDVQGEFTSVEQLRKSVTDYALVSESILGNVSDFRVGSEIISSHMPLTVVLRSTVKPSYKMPANRLIRYK
jgi:hypothetical protein